MMEERYHATTQNRLHPDMSNVNKNITVETKLISPPTYIAVGQKLLLQNPPVLSSLDYVSIISFGGILNSEVETTC